MLKPDLEAENGPKIKINILYFTLNISITGYVSVAKSEI